MSRSLMGLGGLVPYPLLLSQLAHARRTLTQPAAALPVADRAGELLASGLLLVAAAAWTYLLVATGLTALAHVLQRRGGPIASAVTIASQMLVPRALRTCLAGLLGLGLAVGPDAAATADSGPDRPLPAPVTRLDGLPLPDRPVGAGRSTLSDRTVVHVRSGDTLWALAAAELPAEASAARIDRAWRSWYVRNEATIGPDPDLLLPGQRLVMPPGLRGGQQP